MLKFKKITREDFSLIDKYFSMHLSNMGEERLCDYAPGTVKMWFEEYSMEYAVLGDILFLKANYEEEDGDSYLMPVGRTDEGALKALYGHVKDKEGVTLSVIPESIKDRVAQIFCVERGQVFYDRDWVDYIYSREEFENPSGKKHHNYKYNLNKFAKEHSDYSVEQITEDNLSEAIDFYKKYCKENPETSSTEDGEYRATLQVLEELSAYSMIGAVLRAEGRIIGLTIGEIYGDTVIIHTEKAEKTVTGAYPTIARGFLKLLPESVRYVNREEDMGLEGLRRSKLSYAPIRLERKFTLHFS